MIETADGRQFHTTQWALVLAPAQNEAQEGKAALAELYSLYWYPLYAFARRSGHSKHDAQDMTQGFFLHLFEHWPSGLGERKFRSFFLASFQNYLANELNRVRAVKQGGKNQFVSLDWEEGETWYRLEPADFLTAEKIYEARWVMTLLHNVLERLRRQYAAQEKEAVFRNLQVFLQIEVPARFHPIKASP
jgi:RNA polymerase sigma factor (sigma-70 family)